MSRLDLVVFMGETDAECVACRDVFDITSVVAMDGDAYLCPPCAGKTCPGYDQVIRGLSMVHEALTLDLRTEDTPPVVSVLQRLAAIGDRLMAGELQVAVRFELTPDPFGHQEGPIGVLVEREVTRTTEHTRRST